MISRAVKVEKKPELLKELRSTLDSQWNALFQLKVHCSGKEKRTTPCRKGLYLLAYGVYYLVYVLEYLADGLQKNAIKEAFNAFEKGMNETGDYTELILVIGKAASTALDSSMQ
ncbi:hypothetical protein Q1695_003781 [Nippostrongylus brasiliensis]|nr:hypothetical protein Q1695_003781 [Nippostrongylus brasiliensis]